MSVKTYRRGVILICAALCGALTASLNIWSIFQKPLMEAYGFSPQSVSFAYTIVIAMIGLSGPIGGWLQRKAPAHIIMTVAGIGFGLGWFLTGFASTIPVLYISFGLLVGVCDGICYNLALAIATRWYPDKRGFANGVALAIMAIYPLFTWACSASSASSCCPASSRCLLLISSPRVGIRRPRAIRSA